MDDYMYSINIIYHYYAVPFFPPSLLLFPSLISLPHSHLPGRSLGADIKNEKSSIFSKVIEVTDNHGLCKEKTQFGVKTDEHNFSLNHLRVARVTPIVTSQVGKIDLSWFECEMLPHTWTMSLDTWSPAEGVAIRRLWDLQ